MFKYSSLTHEQKKHICNGCGGKGGWIKPPKFIFHASCDQHDFYYWRGCSEDDRLLADISFHKWMKIDISTKFVAEEKELLEKRSKLKWYQFIKKNRYDRSLIKIYIKRDYYTLWAYAYYLAVRIRGSKYFYYGDRQKTLDDLILEVKEIKRLKHDKT